MIIFGSILTTFELSSIFGGSWGSIENMLGPNIEPPSGNLACPKSVKRSLVQCISTYFLFLPHFMAK
jgi:hypothetical protein